MAAVNYRLTYLTDFFLLYNLTLYLQQIKCSYFLPYNVEQLKEKTLGNFGSLSFLIYIQKICPIFQKEPLQEFLLIIVI